MAVLLRVNGRNAPLLFLLAGILAGVAALLLGIGAGQQGPRIWVFGAFSTAITLALFAFALCVAIALPKTFARLIAASAAALFGSCGLIAIYHSQLVTGSIFALPFSIPLIVAAILSALAAWRG